MRTRLGWLLVCAGLLGACTPPVVKIPIGQAALVYGDFKYLQGAVTVSVMIMCRDKKLTETQCVWLAAEADKAVMIDKEIRKSLLDAKGEIDQEKVMQYIQILAGIALKAGGL